MSTSYLYHAYNLKGVQYKSSEYIGNKIILKAQMTKFLSKCRACGSSNVIYRGFKIRRLRLPPSGQKRTMLYLKVHRLGCKDCGCVLWPHLPFAPGKQRYTNSFAMFVLCLLQHMTIKSAAVFTGSGWDLIKMIHKRKIKTLYKRIDLKNIRYISIDEFKNSRKKEQFMTIVIDIQTGRIIHAVEGKNKECILPFLKKLSGKSGKLKAVAMDMGPAYFSAVIEALHHVAIVFDHFHVIKLMNDALDNLRKQLQNQLDKIGKKTLKGSRYLLLANFENLDQKKQNRLSSLLEINKPLFVMHSMKEQLRLFWKHKNKKSANEFLFAWCNTAMEQAIPLLIKVAQTLLSGKSALLNYFDHFISSGKIEGIINKIKTLKRQVYGFRDKEYFKLRLYHLHAQKYSLYG